HVGQLVGTWSRRHRAGGTRLTSSSRAESCGRGSALSCRRDDGAHYQLPDMSQRGLRASSTPGERGAASQARRSPTAEGPGAARTRQRRGEPLAPQPADATEPPEAPTDSPLPTTTTASAEARPAHTASPAPTPAPTEEEPSCSASLPTGRPHP